MAYTPIHLFLQGLTVWLLLPKKTKHYYEKHRWEFLLINLVSILPDIDLLLGAHRTFTHSLVPPIFFLLSLIIIDKIRPKEFIQESSGKRSLRFLKLSSIMWILHIIMDLGYDSILLFWPFDTNFYELSVFFRLENKPWLFLPLTIIGLIPRWKIYSYSTGKNLFFVNISQKEREAIYGNFIDLYMQDIVVYAFLFLIWMVVIFLPAFRRKNGENFTERKFGKTIVTISKRLYRQLTGIGLFILFMGIILGPAIGKSNMYQSNFSVLLTNTHSSFDPTLGFVLEKEKGKSIEVEYKSEIGMVDYNTTVMFVTNQTFFEFFDYFENITEQYYNQSMVYSDLQQEYDQLVSTTYNSSLSAMKLIKDENENGLTIMLNATEDVEVYYFLAVISEWNKTQSFIYTVSVGLTYQFQRSIAIIESIILMGFGIIIIAVDQVFLVPKKMKRKEKTEEVLSD